MFFSCWPIPLLPRSLSFKAPSLSMWLPSHPCSSKAATLAGSWHVNGGISSEMFQNLSYTCEWNLFGKGEGRCASMISSVGWTFQFQHWCRQVTGHLTFLWFTACLLVLGWQMHSVCVWVHSREDQQLVDLNYTRQGSLPLRNISIAWGEIAEYKLCVLQRRHHHWFVLRCIGRLWMRLDSWRYLWERSPYEI